MGAGGQATLTTTRQGGELKANLEIQVPSPLCSASCQATLVLLLIIGASAALATSPVSMPSLLRLENPKGMF